MVSIFLICSVGAASAQSAETFTPVREYVDAFGRALLYQGKQYVPPPAKTTSHQGYKTNNLTEGCTVHFQDLIFEDVPLMYDLALDEVVTLHPDWLLPMMLSKEFVTLFTIDTDTFVYLLTEKAGLPSGYYQQLFHSPDLSSYVKRSKSIKTYSSDWESTYVEYARFYIQTSEDVMPRPIRSRRALLNTFSDKKRELRRLLNASGLLFKREPEQVITFVLKHVTAS